jgi:hypothetical protein
MRANSENEGIRIVEAKGKLAQNTTTFCLRNGRLHAGPAKEENAAEYLAEVGEYTRGVLKKEDILRLVGSKIMKKSTKWDSSSDRAGSSGGRSHGRELNVQRHEG